MPARRFPPPWTVEELDAGFVVRDHNGQQLAYVYFEDEPGHRSAAKLLTRDERVGLRGYSADFSIRRRAGGLYYSLDCGHRGSIKMRIIHDLTLHSLAF